MLLRFEQYRLKVYAQTPQGEFAFGDATGLYEWRRHERISYTGGDRQAAVGGRMLSSGGTGRPLALGFHEAYRRYTHPTN